MGLTIQWTDYQYFSQSISPSHILMLRTDGFQNILKSISLDFCDWQSISLTFTRSVILTVPKILTVTKILTVPKILTVWLIMWTQNVCSLSFIFSHVAFAMNITHSGSSLCNATNCCITALTFTFLIFKDITADFFHRTVARLLGLTIQWTDDQYFHLPISPPTYWCSGLVDYKRL